MPQKSRAHILPISAALLLLAGCGAQQPPAPPPPEVGVVTLKAEPVTLATELPGRVSALETSEVRPQVSGIVERRFFEQGSLVRKGQILYQIQDAPYRAALATAQGNLAMAQAAIRASQLQAERYHRLLAIKGVSQQEVDNADASADQARATVQARKAEVQAARINLDFTRVRAPISGRIGRSIVTAGALVQTGQADALATIQGMGRVYVDVTQPAAELLDLKEAVRAGKVSRDGADAARVALILPNGKTYPVEGHLEFSEVTVDPSSGSVTVRATFPNPDGTLLPGMYVRAKLVEGVRRAAVLAPQQGVTRDERGNSVALVVGKGDKVEQRQLTTDRAIGDKWVVTDGLKPGDRLIVEGLLNVRPGQQVVAKAPEQVAVASAPSGAKGGN
ncbi:efflux RND transporter periplasmic adaptor subunit [Sphingomonas crocodyli]|uniref:Efflux RND transporter periplasmic adaptor subunit n=1 Tax=Sphingomonas crocodyli TaxID=1979270 RepID=A0A437LUJ4_9SPHN|nr:efflux RND transporter periplasmic adaptor subunit [Sphingomonas crocodyli]RVT89101.1 efflux RND transporter periplasmic adaptor subunit [Sphingomonas crocodyli]